jgi:A/G-specific adenine glycosylase
MDFSKIIISWYQNNKRDLPWRKTKNPYKIWLSEIILQQTRVDQGMPYYYKFLQEFPTIFDLAQADEEKVLKNWQGLGYYSRARNLHHTAKTIVSNYQGKFPENFQELLALKGIGEYTAAAIASFAFDRAHAVVDGNVYRVLSRHYGIETPIDSTSGKKEFSELASMLIPQNNAAEYNQAIMEFGAMQCLPKNPQCHNCPLENSCMALNKKTVEKLPSKSIKTKQKERFFNYLIFSSQNKTLINKRTENDIWKNLYDFPLFETAERHDENHLLNSNIWTSDLNLTDFEIKSISSEYKHILSHQKIYAKFWHIELKAFPAYLKEKYTCIPKSKLHDYAVPKLIENYLKII